MSNSWKKLEQTIVRCHQCPRLVAYREQVPAKAPFTTEVYWRKPVPGFGDPEAWLLITGLAPAPHGGNRTGRVFTGDGSGRFLIRALWKSGFANRPTSENIEDGLRLKGCYLTAAVKCVPPLNRPQPSEIANCNCYYEQEIALLSNLSTILVLGRIAFQSFLYYAKRVGISTKGLSFAHGRSYLLENGIRLYACYHPTPRNVNTGLLTEEMLLTLLAEIRSHESK